ncbi:polysaccharide deacetylase family protein [Allorhizobium pseudoryzae]|uniref:polysaccharide deacetylase family protein n=1 Tax=Allorhizobium pseudoryzae TaxID=379684 RepID=UPI003CFF3C26
MTNRLLSAVFLAALLSLSPALPSHATDAKPVVIAAAPSLPVRAVTPRLLEPHLRLLPAQDRSRPQVALTLDACMGKTDMRILSVLIAEQIPATIFVTARWLRSNPEAVAILRQHPELFEVENHGENHVPAVDVPMSIYGIAAAGSAMAVEREVAGGNAAIEAAGFSRPTWFRGSTAKYSPSAIRQIRAMGYRIAGYSLNGDGGSLLGAAMSEKKIASAKDGDVIIAHINQPGHAAGEGVARALADLKRRGVNFVRLSEAGETGDAGTAP